MFVLMIPFRSAIGKAKLDFVFFFACLKSLNVFVQWGFQEETTLIVIHLAPPNPAEALFE